MAAIFKGFALSQFWEASDYADENYVEAPLTAAMVTKVEAELGFKLPAAYLAQMKSQNGGIPLNTCFPTTQSTSWTSDHVAITGIMGVGFTRTYSLCGSLGSKFMQQEWGYPEWGVCVCDCPSAGHDMIMLDYRTCGPKGEPQVIHVDQESDFAVTVLAKDFESFVRGLVNESVFNTSAEDLKRDLKTVETGKFSKTLSAMLAKSGDANLGTVLRNVCHALTVEKDHFYLHDDALSLLVFDFIFYLKPVANEMAYHKVFADALLSYGEGDFSLNGISPDFITKWFKRRVAKGQIVPEGKSMVFSESFRQLLETKFKKHESRQ